MKKSAFLFLLIIPLCKAADDYEHKQQAERAITHFNWQELYKLIDEGKVNVNEVLSMGTPIEIAAGFERVVGLNIVQELIKRGAVLNNALLIATMQYLSGKENLPLINLLLENGADPHEQGRGGSSAFDFVSSMPEWQVGPIARQSLSERKKTLSDLFELYDTRKNIKPAKR